MRNKSELNNSKENQYIIYYLCVHFICKLYYVHLEVNYHKLQHIFEYLYILKTNYLEKTIYYYHDHGYGQDSKINNQY